jgi:hypothetical protein
VRDRGRDERIAIVLIGEVDGIGPRDLGGEHGHDADPVQRRLIEGGDVLERPPSKRREPGLLAHIRARRPASPIRRGSIPPVTAARLRARRTMGDRRMSNSSRRLARRRKTCTSTWLHEIGITAAR